MFRIALGNAAWHVRAAVPHRTPEWSKNRTHRLGRGRLHLDPAAAAARGALALELRSQLRTACARVAHNRLWAAVAVVRPTLDCDAHNALPAVLDAVQLATDLDDRWVCACAAWTLRPGPPVLVVDLWQEDLPDALACSTCSRVLPFDAFPAAARPTWPPPPQPVVQSPGDRRRDRGARDRATCAECRRARTRAGGRPTRYHPPP